MRLLRDISREETNNLANTDARRTAKYLLQYIEVDPKGQHQELLAAVGYLLEKTASQPSFSSSLRADIYSRRANSHHSSRKIAQIIAVCCRALDCDPSFPTASNV